MKWDISNLRNWGWEEHEKGATIIEAGNSDYFSTGNWRSARPVRDEATCSNCLICYMYCPDSSIVVRDNEMRGFDLAHCKGCGICSKECSRGAIKMVTETEAKEGED